MDILNEAPRHVVTPAIIVINKTIKNVAYNYFVFIKWFYFHICDLYDFHFRELYDFHICEFFCI